MVKDFKRPEPLPADLPEMVSYELVRRIFKWKDNRSIRRAVKRGELVRVPIGDSTNALITAESVRKLHEDTITLAETGKQFDISPGRFEAMRRAKKRRDAAPVPQIDVVLDEREIIREAHNLNKTPAPPPFVPPPSAAPAPQSEAALFAAYHTARGAQKAAAYRALTWRQRNQIIEAERAPEAEFDLVAYRKRRAERGY